MNTNKPLCLRMFQEHSYCSWWWNKNINLYYRECSLCGCSFSETSKALSPIGQTLITKETTDHNHNWSPWRSTADRLSLYIPPWQYKRKCCICGAEEVAEDLKKD
jgi:hypothetical protein